jgi:hypothetical protein
VLIAASALRRSASPATLTDPPSAGYGVTLNLFTDAAMNSKRGKAESKK